MKAICIFLYILFASNILFANILPSESLLLVHPSKHYHTSLETIDFTNHIVRKFSGNSQPVIALAQIDILQDPLWYTYRNAPLITSSYYSRMGEHGLAPKSNSSKFTVTVIGGYHSACLGQAVSHLIASFVEANELSELEVILPTRGIFTGFFWKEEKLVPSIEFESYADSSIDGLNLFQITEKMSDQEFLEFINESLKWAIFKRGPVIRSDLDNVQFEILRDGRQLKTFPESKKRKKIRFHYLSY